MDKVKLCIVSEYDDFNSDRSSALRNVIENGIGLNYDSVYKISSEMGFEDTIKTIEEIQPEAIVTLGESPFNTLTGLKDKVSSVRGKRFQLRGSYKGSCKDVPIYPTFASGYILRVPTKLDDFALDIYKAYQHSIGVDEVKEMTPHKIVENFEDLKTLVGYIKETGICAFDFETKSIVKGVGVHEKGFYATMLSISFQAGGSYIIPLEHFQSPFNKKEVDAIMGYLGVHIFSNPDIRKVAHNLDFDAHVLANYGVFLKGRIDDTMLMTHLINETESKGLKETTTRYYPKYAGYEDEIHALVKEYKTWENVPLKPLAAYAATDTDVSLRLLTTLESELQKDEPSYIIYRNLTMYAFRAIWSAEHRGMDIDYDSLSEGIQYTDDLIKAKERELREHKVVKRYELMKSEHETKKQIEALRDKIDAYREKRSTPTNKEKLKQHKIDLLQEEYDKSKDIKVFTKLEKEKAALQKLIDARNTPTRTEQNYIDQIGDLKSGRVSIYEGISFSSPKQLEDLFYNSDYGFKFKGVKGTGKDVLESLNDKSGFVEALLIYRSLQKTQSTYLKGIMDRLDDNNRIHTSLLLSGTRSGRLSSQNPNLQNLPRGAKLDDEGLKEAVAWVKKVFKAPDGYTLVQVDYSQAELRIIGAFAGDENMIKVYKDDGDIHSSTGAGLIGVPIEEFDKNNPKHKEARSDAKAVNFGFIYGMSAEGFVGYAWSNYRKEYSLPEAEKYRNNFFKTYPKLLKYHDIYVQKAEKFGWVRTLYGRRRRTPDINSDDLFKKGNDERVAINSPIQGSAGEFTIFAIALLKDRLDPRVIFVNTVHDSIIFYVPDDILHESIADIKYTCENLPNAQYFGKDLPHGMKMKVDVEVSKANWKSVEEYVKPEE